MLLRCLEQRLEQLAVARLVLGPLGERPPRLGDPLGESVADPLEVAEVEQPRGRRGAGDAAVDLETAEGFGGEAAELAFEAANLSPQLGARGALVGADVLPDRPVSGEELLHGLGASVDDGWGGEGRVG